VKLLPLIYNPVARGGRGRVPEARLAAVAASHGWKLDLRPTRAPGHATELAAQAREAGCELVAVWGGDGTYNEAARGLLGGETAMVILPGGTTSVLAYELGLPRNPVEALAVQLSGQTRKLFVGRTDKGQIFLLMLSVGPDALILHNLPPLWKRYAGKVGITLQAVVEFFRARLPGFSVQANGSVLAAGWCIVGNARFYGGPFAATPGADPFRPGLEAVVQTRRGRAAAIPFFFGIPLGKHLGLSGVVRFAAEEVVLSGEGQVPYQLDGDPAGFLPVTASASQEFVPVRVPAPEAVH
jgi:diacylglycerol kinase family enzyme